MPGTTLRQIITFLTNLERSTWNEVRAQITSSKKGSHRKHHPIPLGRLCPEALRRLEELGLDDFDELFRFRVSGPHRLWGIVHEGIFYPIWWDPDHKVYPLDR